MSPNDRNKEKVSPSTSPSSPLVSTKFVSRSLDLSYSPVSPAAVSFKRTINNSGQSSSFNNTSFNNTSCHSNGASYNRSKFPMDMGGIYVFKYNPIIYSRAILIPCPFVAVLIFMQ